MRRQPYPILSPIKGVDVSKHPLLIPDTCGPNIRGAHVYRGMLRKEVPWYSFGTGLPLTGAVKLIDTFYTSSGSAFLLFATTDYVYLYSPSTDTFAIKNQLDTGVPVAFTGTDDDNFQGAITRTAAGVDIYVLTNGVDAIQKWTGTGEFADLGGCTGIMARAVTTFQTHLLLGYTVESGTACPLRIRWSGIADPEEWADADKRAGFIDLVDTVDWVITFFIVKDKLFILKERSIWELMYVGGTKEFEPVLRINGIGGYAAKAVIPLGEEALIWGSDNIYSFDGLDLTPVGDPLLDMLFSTETKIVNSEKLNRATSVYVEEINEGWFNIPTEGENNDFMLRYNFTEESWMLDNRHASAYGYYSVPLGKTWIEQTDHWNDHSEVWFGTLLPSGAPITLIGTSGGYVYQDTRGVAPEGETIQVQTSFLFESKDWMFGHAERVMEFRFQAEGGPIQFTYSLDGGVTWSAAKVFASITPEKECAVHVNKRTQKIRCRITAAANVVDFKLLWVEPWYIPREKSVSLARL